MAGRISIDLFLTLDGVGQAPGGPDEDREGGFPFGGWQAPLVDEVADADVLERIRGTDALLLGRKTYDVFAAYWPRHTDDEIGAHFAAIPKYVASRSPLRLEWRGAEQLGPDLVTEVGVLRDRHREIHVIGSLDLVQTLLEERLYDELALWVHPVVLGRGKRAFPEGVLPTGLRLLAPPLVSGAGSVLLRYASAGDPRTGDMT